MNQTLLGGEAGFTCCQQGYASLSFPHFHTGLFMNAFQKGLGRNENAKFFCQVATVWQQEAAARLRAAGRLHLGSRLHLRPEQEGTGKQ